MSSSPMLAQLAQLKQSSAPVRTETDALIHRNRGTLEAFRNFACSDVRSWPGNIRDPALRELLFARDRDLPEPQRRLEAQANASSNKIGAQYTQGQINSAGPLIWHAKSACCTTFAIAAAHVLTGGDPKARLERAGGTETSPLFRGTGTQSRRDADGTRVELASVAGTHCLCIVGRDGASGLKGNGRIDDPDTWGDDVRIVDPWLGSLGWPVVYKPSEYPYQDWLVNLESNYDSTKPEPELAAPAEALRTRDDSPRLARQLRRMDTALGAKGLARNPIEQNGNALFEAVSEASPAVRAEYRDAAGLRARVARYVDAHWEELSDYASPAGKRAVVDAVGTDGCDDHPLAAYTPNLVQMALTEDRVAAHLVVESATVRGTETSSMGDAGEAINIARYGLDRIQNNFDPLVSR